jgi:hypothetical protein
MDEGGVLLLEEVEGVDVRWEEDEQGRRKAVLMVSRFGSIFFISRKEEEVTFYLAPLFLPRSKALILIATTVNRNVSTSFQEI